MDVAFGQKTDAAADKGHFRASFPPVTEALPHQWTAPVYHHDGARRPNLPAIATVVALHAVLLVGLVKADVIPLHRKPPPLVVDLIAEPPAPPPPPSTPEPVVVQVQPPRPLIVSPPPLVASPSPPPQVAVVAVAPPPQAVVVAPAPKAAAVVSAPVSVDLSTKMVSGKPPRYPVESRRHREQGTVVLRLTLGLDGAVEAISVAQGSGFDRLDQAALDAVRRWRWSPTLQGGQPVQVRGSVSIPFVLQG